MQVDYQSPGQIEETLLWTEELEASVFVRDIVHHGYRIPFLATPAPVFRYNHQSALQNEQFVFKLVTGSCVLPQAECPLVCSPLSVVQSGKGKRTFTVEVSLRLAASCAWKSCWYDKFRKSESSGSKL